MEDEAELASVVTAFFVLVSFAAGESPDYAALRALFARDAALVKATTAAPERWTVDEFVLLRRQQVASGELASFCERESSQVTELFGNVGHRFSAYEKRGTRHGGRAFATRGMVSTQFVRTTSGWRISSMAWDDERPGLRVRTPAPRRPPGPTGGGPGV
jgi:ketosteroid isomerase-like protein